jgi:xanthine dehydrogenase iron-sulfur cluster and FAD-binding subunit A
MPKKKPAPYEKEATSNAAANAANIKGQCSEMTGFLAKAIEKETGLGFHKYITAVPPPMGPLKVPRHWSQRHLSGHVESFDSAKPLVPQDLLFALNGRRVRIPASDVDPTMTVNEYLRRHTSFTGTKKSCGQGFCSACTVNVSRWVANGSAAGEVESLGMNSCLLLLPTIDGCAITTTEGLGNSRDGYHPLQQRVAGFNGSQCGFCSPGMVMAMYSRIQENGKGMLQKDALLSALDGNFCRCTGYQPLINAASSLCSDLKVDSDLYYAKGGVPPYEPATHDPIFPAWLQSHQLQPLEFTREGRSWHRPTSMTQLAQLVETHKGDAIKLCGGNQLVIFPWLKHGRFTRLVDTRHVPELTQVAFDDGGLTFGAATTISSLRKLLGAAVSGDSTGVPARATSDATQLDSTRMRLYQTAGWAELNQHLSKVASTNLRNSATVIGNLMACQTKAFPSDIATPLFALGAMVTLYPDTKPGLTLQQFLARAPDPQVIVKSITLPWSLPGTSFHVFKVMKRPQNCISDINHAFKCTLETVPDVGDPNERTIAILRSVACLYGGGASPFPQVFYRS